MNDSKNICLSCGFCCDGTVIGFVQLDQEEVPAIKKIMDIEDKNGNGFFLQPCKNYCDGCKVYSARPNQCASYKCGLLKSVEQKEMDFNSAVETIHIVKQKKMEIEQKLALLPFKLQSESFYFKTIELKGLLHKKKSQSSWSKNHLELLRNLQQFDSLLSTKIGV